MEAPILTSDTSQNIFSAPTGSGQALPAGGSALPFAAVLASQGVAPGVQGGAPSNHVPFGMAPLPSSLEQRSLTAVPVEGVDSAVMTTWMSLQGGARSGPPLREAGDELLVEQMSDEQVALYSLAVPAEPVESIGPVGLSLIGQEAEQVFSGEGDEGVGAAFNTAARQLHGGGGEPPLSELQPNLGAALDDTRSIDLAASSAEMQASVQQPSGNAQALSDAARGDRPLGSGALVSDPAIEARLPEERAGLPVTEGYVASKEGARAATGVNANAGSSSTAELEIPADKSTGSEAQRVPLTSAQVAASVQQATGSQVQQQAVASPAAVSKVDSTANTAKSSSPVPVRRQAATESAESTAVNAADGYHWLSEDPSPTAEADASLTVQAKGTEQSTAQALSAPVQSNSANARADGAGSIESFASIKQAVSAEQSAAVQQSAQAEAASLEIETPVRDAQWSQAMAYRVQWMAQQGVQRATVQLNPAELGPLEISVDLADDVAQVQITAESAATREAVEQAVPRLREMMAQSGFGETAVELSSGNEEQDFQQANSGAQHGLEAESSEQGDSRGSARSREPESTQAAGVERQVSTVTSDGRLSFYV